jgi:hypothetical protein
VGTGNWTSVGGPAAIGDTSGCRSGQLHASCGLRGAPLSAAKRTRSAALPRCSFVLMFERYVSIVLEADLQRDCDRAGVRAPTAQVEDVELAIRQRPETGARVGFIGPDSLQHAPGDALADVDAAAEHVPDAPTSSIASCS